MQGTSHLFIILSDLYAPAVQTPSVTIIPHERQMSNKIFAYLKFFMKVCFLHMFIWEYMYFKGKEGCPAGGLLCKSKTDFHKAKQVHSVCRGRCPHRPGRAHRFYENLRRIRNCLTGRCGHRPLQSKWKARTNSPQNSSQRLYSVRADRVVRPYKQAGSAVS